MAQVVINTNVKLGEGTLTQDALTGLSILNQSIREIQKDAVPGSPLDFYNAFSRRTVIDLKALSALNLSSVGWGILVTFVPGVDISTPAIQVVYDMRNNTDNIGWARKAASNSSWTAWKLM